MKMFFYFLFFLSCISVYSQTERDSTNVISYDSDIMIRSNFYTNKENYFYSYNGEEINLATNNKIYTSVSLDYEIISVAVGFAPNIFSRNRNDDLKGKSSFSQIRFSIFPKNFIQTVSYKRNKGFFLKNTKDFNPNWDEDSDPYIQFPDLKIEEFAGTTSYVFNKNFSVKSIDYQTEWQKKSSGSLITSLDYNLTITHNKIEGSISRDNQFNFGLNVGYHYNYIVSKHITISPHVVVGLGGKSETDSNLYLDKRLGGGLFLGYNTDKFLFGTKINFSSSSYKINSGERVENDIVNGLFYIGFRFKPPKVISKNYNDFQQILPF